MKLISTIGNLLGSKKAVMLILLVVLVIVAMLLQYSLDDIERLVKVVGGFLYAPWAVSQGISDHGKEKAKVEKGGE